MKLIVLALTVLAAAAALVVLIGFLLPREHVASRSALVRGTPDKVFAWLDGPQHWRPAVASRFIMGHTSTIDAYLRDLERAAGSPAAPSPGAGRR